MYDLAVIPHKPVWNKDKLIGQKLPLTVQQIYGIRVRLDFKQKLRDLALFNLGIDSKLRGIDLLKLKVKDVATGVSIQSRAMIIQQKTGRPVQFEITKPTREVLAQYIKNQTLAFNDFLFQSRKNKTNHLSTRQYQRIVKEWINSIGLDSNLYSTHSIRRTKPSLIYKKTKNIRVCQLLLGHAKLESTVRYLGVEVEDALEVSEGLDI
jgi:integrase